MKWEQTRLLASLPISSKSTKTNLSVSFLILESKQVTISKNKLCIIFEAIVSNRTWSGSKVVLLNFSSAIDFLFSVVNSPALSGKVGVKRAGVTGATPQFTKVAKTGI